MKIPFDVATTDPSIIAEWIVDNAKFEFSVEENEMLSEVTANKYTGASHNVYLLFELRVLFWQTIGANRK